MIKIYLINIKKIFICIQRLLMIKLNLFIMIIILDLQIQEFLFFI